VTRDERTPIEHGRIFDALTASGIGGVSTDANQDAKHPTGQTSKKAFSKGLQV
jgi:hypothetical protein